MPIILLARYGRPRDVFNGTFNPEHPFQRANEVGVRPHGRVSSRPAARLARASGLRGIPSPRHLPDRATQGVLQGVARAQAVGADGNELRTEVADRSDGAEPEGVFRHPPWRARGYVARYVD